jgi:hypothetical protein
MIQELKANRIQTKEESNRRRNPEYWKIANKIQRLRKRLKTLQNKGIGCFSYIFP